uniref:GNAT family N-acetyltransferase n=1 Tax=Streptomyces sp. NBC_00049 TaxID=2903617 RepID=A0AAU2JL31_9ACTN
MSMQITRIDSCRIDLLAPLWKSLHRHHTDVAAHLEPLGAPLSPDASWDNRRVKYAQWLASPDAFALVAEIDGEPVAYAMARVKAGGRGSWERGAKTGVLETLSVEPGRRGAGIGTRLMDAVRAEFAARGAGHFELDVIAGNESAVRFYARHGFVPYVTTMVSRIE